MSTGHLLHLLVVVFQTLTTCWLFHLFVVDVGDVVAAALVGATALLAGVAAHVVGVESGTGVGIGISRLLPSYIMCIIYSHSVHKPK